MPTLSVWMLRAALVHLIAGAALGAWLLAGLQAGASGSLAFRQAHLALMLFGWLGQFVLGVAYWIMPRYATQPERGPAGPAWAAFVGLQAGVVLMLAGAASPSAWPGEAGRALASGSSLAFVILLWGRIKPFGAG